MYELIANDKFKVNGYDVYSVSLSQNNFIGLDTHEQVIDFFMGIEVSISGNAYTVIGVEQFATPHSHDRIALMVKPIALS